MQNRAAVTLISVALIVFLLFQSLHPYGFFYSYLHQQEQETTTHKKRKAIILPPYIGLAPQKVADVDGEDATRDTYQRKVFYDSTYFFVVYWTGAPTREMRYKSSVDGVTWGTAVTLGRFSVGPYYGGNVDVQYPNRGARDLDNKPYNVTLTYSGSNGLTWYVEPASISDGVLTLQDGSAVQIGSGAFQGGSITANLNGVDEYCIAHHPAGYWGSDRIFIFRFNYARGQATGVAYGGTTTGGNQILNYKTSSPYKMLALAKAANNTLYYAIVNENGSFATSFNEVATLTTGFSDFCGASEAQYIGGPERVHLVYIKSSGELCYRKFENDAWSNELTLVENGASYPVIACGEDGRLYVFYVKDAKIWLIKFDGSSWHNAVEFFTDQHTYNNPTYLSTNQNVQNGKICLVWTEGTEAPYEVWFSYINDE